MKQNKRSARKERNTWSEAIAFSLSLSFCSCSFTNTDLGSKTNLATTNNKVYHTISSMYEASY